jgi:short-subunit dehydrogenase
MTDNKCGDKLAAALKGQEIDILINNAGYFYEPVEKIDSLNFEEVTKRGTASILITTFLFSLVTLYDYTYCMFLRS